MHVNRRLLEGVSGCERRNIHNEDREIQEIDLTIFLCHLHERTIENLSKTCNYLGIDNLEGKEVESKFIN